MNSPRTPRAGFGLARILGFCVGVPVMALLLYWMMAPGHPPAPAALVDVQGAPLIEAVASPEEAPGEAPASEATASGVSVPEGPVEVAEVASTDPAPMNSPSDSENVAGAEPMVVAAEVAASEGASLEAPLDGAVVASVDRLVTGDGPSLLVDAPAPAGDAASDPAAIPAAPGPYAPAAPTPAAFDPNVPRVVPDFSKRSPNDKGNLELTFTDLACYIYEYPELETVEYDQDAVDAAGASSDPGASSEAGAAAEPPPPPPAPAHDSGGRIPEAVMQLTGKSVELQGFMIPTEVEKGKIRGFILVKDQAGCCFGVMPMMNEWVHVTMDEGRTSDFLPDIPLKVTGVLDVGEEIQDGMVVSLYRMKGLEVLPLQAPATGPDFWGSNF